MSGQINKCCKCKQVQTKEQRFYKEAKLCYPCYNKKRTATKITKECSCCKIEQSLSTRGWVFGHLCQTCYNRTPEVKARMVARDKTSTSRYSKMKRKDRYTDISPQLHAKLLSLPCHYCRGKLNEMGIGLDRVDNDLGYLVSNVVPCCGRCNAIKGMYLSYEEMMGASELWLTMRSNTSNVI